MLKTISEILACMKDLTVIGKVAYVSAPKPAGEFKVARAVLRDENNKEIYLNLWNNDIEKVKEGDVVQVEGAYVSMYKTDIQLNVPKDGKLTITK